MGRKLLNGLMIVGAMLLIAPALASADVTFNVTSQADANQADLTSTSCASTLEGGPCTLRSSIEAANNETGQAVTINVPAGTYTLSAMNQDTPEHEIPITAGPSSVSILGAGAGSTIVDPNFLDRAFDVHSGATVTISGLTVEHGRAGGIGDVSSCPESFPNGVNPGGGILNDGALTLTGDVITDNIAAGSGGGVENEDTGSVSVTGTTISNNAACTVPDSFSGLGGGFDDAGGPVTIDTSTIEGNTAQSDGGGVTQASIFLAAPVHGDGAPHAPVTGSVTITNSTISGNQSSGEGGGVEGEGNGGTISLFADAVTGNTASSDGGGIGGNDTDSIVNSTITGNAATNNPGGGVENAGAPVTISFSTINGNTAVNGGDGGNIANNDSASFTLDDSIVTGGTPNNCTSGGGIASAGHNLFDESGANCGALASDLTNQNPDLGTLQNNGGPTATEALQKGSPAIDAADDTACASETKNSGGPAVDQRGVVRPQGPHCDIGAFEATPDLGLASSAQNNPIQVGQQDTVTDVVANNGPEQATGVTFDDPAAGFTIDSVTASQGSCTHTATTVHCDLGTIPSGGHATITIVLTATSAGTITLNGSTNMAEFDPTPGNDKTTLQITVEPAPTPGSSADMAISIARSTKHTVVGHKFGYTLRVRNNGPDPAQSVSVTDNLPSGVKLIKVGGGAHCSGKHTITCSLGTTSPNSTSDIKLTVRARHAGKAKDKAVVADASPGDPNLSNNSASATVDVVAKPSVKIAPIGVICPTPGSPAQITVTGKAAAGIRKVVIQLGGRTVETFTARGVRSALIHVPVTGSGLSAGQTYTVTAVLTDKLGQTAHARATLTMCSGVPS